MSVAHLHEDVSSNTLVVVNQILVESSSSPSGTDADLDDKPPPTLSPLWQQTVIAFGSEQYAKHSCASLIPSASASENLAFQEDVRRRGQIMAILVSGNQVVDGWRLLVATLAADLRPRFVKVNDEDALAICLTRNIHRRHLSAGQRAAIAAHLQDWSQACTHGGVRDQAALVPLARVSDRQALSGGGQKTQQAADFVAKRSTELIKQVIAGSISVDQAVAKLKSEAKGEATVDRPDPHARCKHRFEESAAKELAFEALIATRDAEIVTLRERIADLERDRVTADVDGM